MTFICNYDRNFNLKKTDILANKLEEWILPEEEKLKQIVKKVTGYDGNYFFINRTLEKEYVHSIEKNKTIPKEIPILSYSILKTYEQARMFDDDFDDAHIRFDLSWEKYRPEWIEFFKIYKNSCENILDFVNRNKSVFFHESTYIDGKDVTIIHNELKPNGWLILPPDNFKKSS
ncbi:MAG: hypothetical protein WC755_05650 [Candidatus Woesearchaeota archaeon]|jgi:hypothetical protein